MKILFVHQNFPGQYKNLAPALAADGHDVVALSMRKHPPTMWNGVRVLTYQAQRGSAKAVHPWVSDFETKVIRGEACLQAAMQLKRDGFEPDAIVVHPGWGEGLFLRDVWPRARIGLYCEFFYRTEGQDVNFDPEFTRADDLAESRLRIKNAANLLQMEEASAGLAPTHWQASTFPEPFRSTISVAHDGIDTQLVAPRPDVEVPLRNAAGELKLTRGDEVITFVNRNLEPYRGYHVFMRALPALLAARPNARVVIVGADDVSYGSRPPQGKTWKQVFIEEVRPRIADADWQRVLYVGTLQYPQFITMLQLSTVHVYLTYPFVLSWSLLEAMSAGCAIVASDTAPVREAIRHDDTGKLVDFFDVDGLARQVAQLSADAEQRKVLGARARAHAVANYDLKAVCLPQQVEWVKKLAG
ncbi:MAG TPA: glycosyltransferase [Ramlibacter sp.]|jgi:glycosyltransferase involved in cell wall biosynthesis|nr:glycosyltransferase [Ramlibacter sp.]